MRVREELESTTVESEAEKSFTYRCKNCSQWFKNKDIDWNCPNCGEDALYIALKCKICDKWYYKDELGEFNCRKCKVKLVK
jgi:Zn finger protein HypA/HybF involved in hydrogenase expression